MHDTNRAARIASLETHIDAYVRWLRREQVTLLAPVAVPPPIEMSPSVSQQVARAIGMRAA